MGDAQRRGTYEERRALAPRARRAIRAGWQKNLLKDDGPPWTGFIAWWWDQMKSPALRKHWRKKKGKFIYNQG